MSTEQAIPASIGDPVNDAILAVSEDQLRGFQPDPFGEIAARSGLPPELVIERVRAMLEAGTVRRVRQTMITTNLAAGALVAWRIPAERLSAAFDYMFDDDPFSGHVVLRSTDGATAGADYRLWTTVKVPQGYSLAKHTDYLAEQVGATALRILPAKRLFVLGVGHTRRRNLEPGSKAANPARAIQPHVMTLTEEEWRVLAVLKREFDPQELRRDLWQTRAAEAGCSLERFYQVARSFDTRQLVGRFSTFLEHVKPLSDGQRVTSYNALFHWAVPLGRELEAGTEIGRHDIFTHAYWREAGPEFGNVNIMGVVHGTDKDLVMAHKAALDKHLESLGIPVSYTNVFWGGRSEIKPSEVLPDVYRDWCRSAGLDPETMRDESQPAASEPD